MLHHADHELQQLRAFCPRQYFTGALNTWQAPELFEPLPHLTASHIHDHLSATIPPTLRARYKWGFRKDFTIPYGVVHLKAKKQWQKGRAIISCFQSLSGNLLRITSQALDIVLQHLFPQHPGQLSIPQLWHHFHSYLHATNDDLVVPQHRLIDAVHSLIQQWQSQQATHTLTVDTKATGNPFHRSHVGRHYTKPPTQRTIHTSDITTIVAFALNTCIFRACNNTYKQIRGAGIGSQLSPALCNVAITLIEHSWHQLHNNLLQHAALHFTYYRYVDNRFIVHNEHLLHSTSSNTNPDPPQLFRRSNRIRNSGRHAPPGLQHRPHPTHYHLHPAQPALENQAPVCVNPCAEGFSTHDVPSNFFSSRGAVNLIPSTAQRRRWFEIVKRERTLSRVPAELSASKLSPHFSTVCFMVLHASTPETLVLQLSRTARSLPLSSAVTHKQFVQPSSALTFSPRRSLTIFDLGIELTANQCQSVTLGLTGTFRCCAGGPNEAGMSGDASRDA